MNRTTVIAVVAGIAVVGLGFYLYSRRRSSIGGPSQKSGVTKQHTANGTPTPSTNTKNWTTVKFDGKPAASANGTPGFSPFQGVIIK